MDIFFNVGLEAVAFCQLALDVCCEPDLGQRASLLEEGLGIEHDDWEEVCKINATR